MNNQNNSEWSDAEFAGAAPDVSPGYEMQRVSDVAPALEPFEGQKLKLRQLVDKTFTVLRIVELSGEHGPYVGVQIEGDGKPFFFFSGHKVVLRKLAECVGHEPLLATVRRVEPDGAGNPYFDIE